MNFSGKGHSNIQPSTRPGIEPGTSGLGGRDLNHCAKPSTIFRSKIQGLKTLFWAKRFPHCWQISIKCTVRYIAAGIGRAGVTFLQSGRLKHTVKAIYIPKIADYISVSRIELTGKELFQRIGKHNV